MRKFLKVLTAITLSLLLIFGSTLGSFATQNTSIHLKTGSYKTELAGLNFYVYLEGHVGTNVTYHSYVGDDPVTILPMSTQGNSGQYTTPDLALEVDPQILYFMIGGLKYYIGVHIDYIGKEGGGTINYEIKAMPAPPLGSITIHKTISGDVPMVDSDFEFEIYSVGYPNVPFETATINGEGHAVIPNVPIGNYYVKEVNLPDRYSLESMNDQPANVTLQMLNPSVTFDNEYTEPDPELGTITIHKTLSGPEPPLDAEFEFQIIIPGEEEELYATVFITGAGTEIEYDVPIGEYIVREVNVPQLYTLSTENDLEAAVNENDMDPEVTFDNTYREPDPDLGTITINKTLSGATPPSDEEFEFQIIIPGEVEELYATVFITGAGTEIEYEVPIGEYIVREVNLPTNYFINSSNDQDAIVDEEDMDPEVTFDNTYREPDPELGSITIIKDIIGNTPPSNATFSFQLVGPLDSEGSTIRNFNIIGEGSTTFNDLIPGVYRITESTPPTNYTIESGNNALISIEEVLSAEATVTNRYTAPTPDPDPDPDPTPDPDPDPDRGTVRVFYIDVDDNLLDPIFEFTGPIGTNYGTAARTYEGLELVATPGNAFGTFIDGIIDVIYVYSPPVEETLILPIEEEEVPLGVPEIPDEELVLEEEIPLGDALPQTGQLPAELFYGFGSLISLIGVAFRKGRKSR